MKGIVIIKNVKQKLISPFLYSNSCLIKIKKCSVNAVMGGYRLYYVACILTCSPGVWGGVAMTEKFVFINYSQVMALSL